MQKSILRQFFHSCDLFCEFHSFVTIKIYLQLFCSGIPSAIHVDWSWYEVLQRINGWKWNKRELAVLNCTKTYNFSCSYAWVFMLAFVLRLTFAKKNANEFEFRMFLNFMSKIKKCFKTVVKSAQRVYRTGFDHYCYACCAIVGWKNWPWTHFTCAFRMNQFWISASSENRFAKLVSLFSLSFAQENNEQWIHLTNRHIKAILESFRAESCSA